MVRPIKTDPLKRNINTRPRKVLNLQYTCAQGWGNAENCSGEPCAQVLRRPGTRNIPRAVGQMHFEWPCPVNLVKKGCRASAYTRLWIFVFPARPVNQNVHVMWIWQR